MIRVLDPANALVRPDARPPKPTLYVAEDLLVTGDRAFDAVSDDVAKVLGDLGWTLEPVGKPRRREPVDLPLRLQSQPTQVFRLQVDKGRDVTEPPDAWVALQRITASIGDRARIFALNHVLLPAGGGGGYWGGIGGGGGYWGGIGGGGGYWGGIGGGGGYWGGIGMSGPAQYGIPGLGGKAPVALVVADPARCAPDLARPPVVVMPDSGIGRHPWFKRQVTTNAADPQTQQAPRGVVTVVGTTIPDDSSGLADPLSASGSPLAGHGTFVAGIIRQKCPAARLEAHVLMDADGVIVESDLIDALHTLLDRQLHALLTRDPALVVDVLSISAGYYHENSDDDPIDTSVEAVLRDLGRAGVLVVAGAGNDATDRPFLPAGFAAHPLADGLGLVSVGSLNPNTSSVALFSNAGAWVKVYRTGAAIVSTFPVPQNAAAQPDSEVAGIDTLDEAGQQAVADGTRPAPPNRATIDLDDFSGGFGVWSGTSFATPVVAGQLAQYLVRLGTEDVSLEAMLKRGRAALAKVVSS